MAAERGKGPTGGTHPPLLWYVSGNLDRGEREEIRLHIDACARCQAEVEALTGIRSALRDQGKAAGWHVAEEVLISFEDDDPALSLEQRATIQEHLRECPACREDLAALDGLRKSLAGPTDLVREEEHEGAAAAKRMRRWWWIPAAAAAGLILTALWQFGEAQPAEVTLLPPHRGNVSSRSLSGDGPWSIAVVLPLTAPAGRYHVSIRGPDGAPVFTTEAETSGGKAARKVVIRVRSLPTSGEYLLTLEPLGVPSVASYEYRFLRGVEGAGEAAVQPAAPDLEAVRAPRDQVRFEDAEREARRQLHLVEATHGAKSLAVASVLDLLVESQWKGRSATEESVLLARRAVRIKEDFLGPHAPELETSVTQLAHAVRVTEGLAASRPHYERALSIRERVLGPSHPDVARALNNVANVLMAIGEYGAGIPYFERSVAILEVELGAEDPQVAIPRNGLAILKRRTGAYREARALFEKNLALQERVLGPASGEVLGTLNNLAGLLLDMGLFAEAEPLYRRALTLSADGGDPGSSTWATGLCNYAWLLIETGEPERAGGFVQRAIRLYDEGERGSDLQESRCRVILAEVMFRDGRGRQALAGYEAALNVQRRVFRNGHPELSDTLGGYARVLWAQGDRDAALAHALEAESIARRQFRQTARALTEREALEFEKVRANGMELALSVLTETEEKDRNPDAIREAWDAVVLSRGLVLDEVAARHSATVTSRDPEVRSRVETLAAARERLARLVLGGPDALRGVDFAERVTELLEEKTAAERALASASAAFERQLATSRTGLREVIAALPAGSALVAYARYAHVPASPAAPSVPSYAALVSRRDGSGPKFVPLGSAGEIERRIEDWRIAAGTDPRAGSPGERVQRYGRTAARLREVLWDPLETHLEGADRVFVVPDASIHLINLATLPTTEGPYLLETGPLLHYLSAERDLVRPVETPGGKGLLALGGPHFDSRPGRTGAAWASTTDPPSLYRGPTTGCEEFRAMTFHDLPAAAGEVEEIAALFTRQAVGAEAGNVGTVELSGSAADEASFKRLAPGRRIVHVATHGFFLEDRCRSGSPSGGTRTPSVGAGTGDPPLTMENPLLLCGLALAGANRRVEAALDEEDGILTCEEIASLDLTGVEWAVLSACGTGLGEVMSGEGVLGLRRSFQMAGAGTLIMSLWRVDDDATRLWMKGLYEARLSGASTAEAVRESGLRLLADLGDEDGRAHPFFWGSFVAAGDWR